MSEFPNLWRQLLNREWYVWRCLSAEQRSLLEPRLAQFVRDTRWEEVRGFQLTEPMKVLIAAQASLLALELGPDSYRAVGSVIVRPTTVVLRCERSVGVGGVVTNSPMAIEGQASFGGPLVLAWDAVRRDAASPHGGRNVVFHEFAHALDMTDRVLDGTPQVGDTQSRQRWIEVCTAAFNWLSNTEQTSVLRDYATTDPGEFFAVATETFFTQPAELLAEQPALFAVLRAFYGQDPLQYVPD